MKPSGKTFFRVLEHLIFAAVLVAAGLLLTAGYWLQTSDSPAPSEAMVVLGGNYLRPVYAAELYKLGMTKKIYVTRVSRDPDERALDENNIPFPRREEIYRSVLLKKGVPPEAVEYYGDDVLSTIQEAEALAAHLGKAPQSLLVVTSPYHARRSRSIFKRVFPNTEVRVVGTPAESIPAAWWTTQGSARVVLLEIPKNIYLLLGGAFRSPSAQK